MENFKFQLEQLIEPLARQFAAEKMKLVEDKYGEQLPYELWKQYITDAKKFLNLG